MPGIHERHCILNNASNECAAFSQDMKPEGCVHTQSVPGLGHGAEPDGERGHAFEALPELHVCSLLQIEEQSTQFPSALIPYLSTRAYFELYFQLSGRDPQVKTGRSQEHHVRKARSIAVKVATLAIIICRNCRICMQPFSFNWLLVLSNCR